MKMKLVDGSDIEIYEVCEKVYANIFSDFQILQELKSRYDKMNNTGLMTADV